MSHCKCNHPPRQIGTKWVRLSVSDTGKTARLKCLACSWKWGSTAKYAFQLRTHVEETRKGMTWEHVLIRLHVARDLRVDPVTAIVETCRPNSHHVHQPWKVMRQIPDSHDSGYRFVEVSYKGMKRKVAVHVLIWMQEHGSATSTGIPDGHEVHHLKSPPRPLPKNNALSNLDTLPKHVNNSGKLIPDDNF